MSDELDERLRAACRTLPAPGEDDTKRARVRFVAAAAGRRPVRRERRRILVAALAAVLAVGAAFGGGFAVASGTRAEEPARPAPRAQLDAGPGFLPAIAAGTSSRRARLRRRRRRPQWPPTCR